MSGDYRSSKTGYVSKGLAAFLLAFLPSLGLAHTREDRYNNQLQMHFWTDFNKKQPYITSQNIDPEIKEVFKKSEPCSSEHVFMETFYRDEEIDAVVENIFSPERLIGDTCILSRNRHLVLSVKEGAHAEVTLEYKGTGSGQDVVTRFSGKEGIPYLFIKINLANGYEVRGIRNLKSGLE